MLCAVNKMQEFRAVFLTSTNKEHIQKITLRKYHNKPVCQYCALNHITLPFKFKN